MKKRLTVVEMIREFQCVGCVNGPDPETCPRYKLNQDYGAKCSNHCPGTNLLGRGRIALGLPIGFNRYGLFPGPTGNLSDAINGHMFIRLFVSSEEIGYDKFNVPVWRLEQDGILFVRCFAPRVNASYLDVIQMNDRLVVDIAPQAIDVADFYNDMD